MGGNGIHNFNGNMVQCTPVMGGKWIDNFNGNMVQSTHCTMLPLKLSIHFAPIAVCTLYHVTIYVVKSLPTHNRVYSVPCYHRSWQFTSHPYTLLWVGSELTTSMVTWYRVHTAMGGKWIDNFNGNMVQSTLSYGWEVNSQHKCVLCAMLPLKLWIHFPPIAVCTLYHVTIYVVKSLPTHNRVYSVPC
jgi:Zn-finger protein